MQWQINACNKLVYMYPKNVNWGYIEQAILIKFSVEKKWQYNELAFNPFLGWLGGILLSKSFHVLSLTDDIFQRIKYLGTCSFVEFEKIYQSMRLLRICSTNNIIIFWSSIPICQISFEDYLSAYIWFDLRLFLQPTYYHLFTGNSHHTTNI